MERQGTGKAFRFRQVHVFNRYKYILSIPFVGTRILCGPENSNSSQPETRPKSDLKFFKPDPDRLQLEPKILKPDSKLEEN